MGPISLGIWGLVGGPISPVIWGRGGGAHVTREMGPGGGLATNALVATRYINQF